MEGGNGGSRIRAQRGTTMPELTNWVAGAAAVKSAFDTSKSVFGLLKEAKGLLPEGDQLKRPSPWRSIPPQHPRKLLKQRWRRRSAMSSANASLHPRQC